MCCCTSARPHGRMDAWAFALGFLADRWTSTIRAIPKSQFPESQVPKKSTSKAPSAQVPKLPSSQDRRGARPASSAPRTGRVGVHTRVRLRQGSSCHGRRGLHTVRMPDGRIFERAGRSGLGWAYVTPRSRLESRVSRCHLRGGARGGRRDRGEVGVPGLDVSCRAAGLLRC